MIQKLLKEKKIRRVLLTNHFLKIFSGSELITFDIAKTFKQYGIEVVCATFINDLPLEQFFREAQIPIVNLIHHPQKIYQQDFDLIWSHHWPVLGYCLNELKVNTSYLVTSSLSTCEPLEIISLTQKEADVILFNSPRTKSIHINEIHPSLHYKGLVFLNSLTSKWFEALIKKESQVKHLQKIAVISNHIASELIEACEYLQSQGIEISFIGLEYTQKYITPNIIEEYDAIISIGHSVQKSLARGVPIYCYDRFGGPGWITPENIDSAEFHHYSGLCCFRQLNAQDIAQEILDGYAQTLEQVDNLRSIAMEKYSLEKNISKVLNLLPEVKSKSNWEQNTDFRKLSQLYLRSKFNVIIPPVINIDRFQSGVVCLSIKQTSKEIWQKYLAHFSLDKISTFRFEVGQKFHLRGVALGKDAEHRILEIKLQDGEVCLAKSQLGLHSPGLGKQYPKIPFAFASRFAFKLPKLPNCNKVSLIIKLIGGQKCEMAMINITRQ